MILKSTNIFHKYNIPEFDLLSIVFNLNEVNASGFKRLVKCIFSDCLKEYRCYCFFLIGHTKTSRINKRKNEIKLASIVNGGEVGYIVMDGGVFACFEVNLSNFDRVYEGQYKFVFSQDPNFFSSFTVELESSSYDAFVGFFLFMTPPFIDNDEFNLRSEFYYTPLFERCFRGDFFIKVHFSDIYSEKKMLSAFYKKGNACPILDLLVKN